MRILHTSDWHLGRSFHREDLLAAPGARTSTTWSRPSRSERVDAVVVVGRRLRPGPAAGRRGRAVRRRARAGWPRTGARVVLTSGNHDSARRLGFGSGLIDAAGVHLRTDVAAAHRPVLLDDAHGPVAVYGIPYLEPDVVRGELGLRRPQPRGGARRGDGPGPRRPRRPAGHPLGGAGARLRRRRRSPATASATSASAASPSVPPSVVRRRRLRRAGPPARRPAADRPGPLQRLAAAYSFSEAHHTKGSWLVDLGAGRAPRCRSRRAHPGAPSAGAAARPPRRPAHRPRARRRSRTTACR